MTIMTWLRAVVAHQATRLGLLALRLWLLALLGAPALLISAPPAARAQEAVISPPPDAASASEIDRAQWRARVEEARRRAQAFKQQQRDHPPPPPAPPLPDRAEIASRRVPRQDSLLPGDIVATKQGLLVFQGHLDPQHPERDFIALPK